MFRFLRLILLRPRFLAECISISTQPSAFVRERIQLGDTTNFLRAAGFFLSAISTAFLAEVATLNLLGIGDLTEPYYWLFILLTSIPFILFCFLLVRLVTHLSFKDVLHISLYPMGAGVFTGAFLLSWLRRSSDCWSLSAIFPTSKLISPNGVTRRRSSSRSICAFCVTA